MTGRTPLCAVKRASDAVRKGEWFRGSDESEWQAVYQVRGTVASGSHVAWVCKCKCGQVKTIRADFLIGGKATCVYTEQG